MILNHTARYPMPALLFRLTALRMSVDRSGSLRSPFLRCGTATCAGLGSMLFKFNLFIEYHSFSALDSNLAWGRCLTHVGTEGLRHTRRFPVRNALSPRNRDVPGILLHRYRPWL